MPNRMVFLWRRKSKSAWPTTRLTPSRSDYVDRFLIGGLQPGPDIGGIAGDKRNRSFDSLHQLRPLRAAQVQHDVPEFRGAISARVNCLPGNDAPVAGWPPAKFAALALHRHCRRLLRVQGVRPGLGRGAVSTEVNRLLRLAIHHGGEMDGRLILLAFPTKHSTRSNVPTLCLRRPKIKC
jgi:hypothetical protein